MCVKKTIPRVSWRSGLSCNKIPNILLCKRIKEISLSQMLADTNQSTAFRAAMTQRVYSGPYSSWRVLYPIVSSLALFVLLFAATQVFGLLESKVGSSFFGLLLGLWGSWSVQCLADYARGPLYREAVIAARYKYGVM